MNKFAQTYLLELEKRADPVRRQQLVDQMAQQRRGAPSAWNTTKRIGNGIINAGSSIGHGIVGMGREALDTAQWAAGHKADAWRGLRKMDSDAATWVAKKNNELGGTLVNGVTSGAKAFASHPVDSSLDFVNRAFLQPAHQVEVHGNKAIHNVMEHGLLSHEFGDSLREAGMNGLSLGTNLMMGAGAVGRKAGLGALANTNRAVGATELGTWEGLIPHMSKWTGPSPLLAPASNSYPLENELNAQRDLKDYGMLTGSMRARYGNQGSAGPEGGHGQDAEEVKLNLQNTAPAPEPGFSLENTAAPASEGLGMTNGTPPVVPETPAAPIKSAPPATAKSLLPYAGWIGGGLAAGGLLAWTQSHLAKKKEEEMKRKQHPLAQRYPALYGSAING